MSLVVVYAAILVNRAAAAAFVALLATLLLSSAQVIINVYSQPRWAFVPAMKWTVALAVLLLALLTILQRCVKADHVKTGLVWLILSLPLKLLVYDLKFEHLFRIKSVQRHQQQLLLVLSGWVILLVR